MTATLAPAENHRATTRVGEWERRTANVVLAAAILPIVVGLAGEQNGWVVWIDLVSWVIFAIDLVVHLRLQPGHLRTKLGLFDLFIVVLTAPWYLIPGLGGGNVVSLVRLARLGRVFLASSHSRSLQALTRRLGTAALWSVVLMATCAAVVYIVEPVSSGFETFGDSMWWAMVTFATVGYGDYAPVTTGGRIAAVLLMLGGIALIGSLAGSLGSFFGESESRTESPTELPPGSLPGLSAGSTGVSDEPTSRQLLDEIQALRAEVAELRSSIPGPTTVERESPR